MLARDRSVAYVLAVAPLLGFLWGLAEGIIFFILPDVLLSFVALAAVAFFQYSQALFYRFDGSFILNTKPWDIAASEMIAREAGAKVSSPSAAITEMAIFAGPALLDELVGAVSPADGTGQRPI